MNYNRKVWQRPGWMGIPFFTRIGLLRRYPVTAKSSRVDAFPESSGTGQLQTHRRQRCSSIRQIWVLLCLAWSPLQLPAARVIEAGAIPFTAFLSKADFDQRYPGQELTDLSQLDPGWYVIYQHESLSYYFGPVLLESTGQDYLTQLTQTVENAVAQRPSNSATNPATATPLPTPLLPMPATGSRALALPVHPRHLPASGPSSGGSSVCNHTFGSE